MLEMYMADHDSWHPVEQSAVDVKRSHHKVPNPVKSGIVRLPDRTQSLMPSTPFPIVSPDVCPFHHCQSHRRSTPSPSTGRAPSSIPSFLQDTSKRLHSIATVSHFAREKHCQAIVTRLFIPSGFSLTQPPSTHILDPHPLSSDPRQHDQRLNEQRTEQIEKSKRSLQINRRPRHRNQDLARQARSRRMLAHLLQHELALRRPVAQRVRDVDADQLEAGEVLAEAATG